MILPPVQKTVRMRQSTVLPADDFWTSLSVSSDAQGGYAYVELPINGAAECNDLCIPVYGNRLRRSDYAVETYYFRVAVTDAPPVITGGPWLAAGSWPMLATSDRHVPLY